MKQENAPTIQPTQTIDKKLLYRGNKKQKLFMEYWSNPDSPTFANVYKSGLKAGFSPSYSKNIANVAPSWLVSFIDKIEMTETHIEQGISRIATGDIDSRSVDDTRLKAFELLMKLKANPGKYTWGSGGIKSLFRDSRTIPGCKGGLFQKITRIN